MTVQDFQNYMTTLSKEQSLSWIAFSGGEPFLFYKTLRRCIQLAHRLGQKNITVFTSGHWGGNQTKAQKKLQELKHAGLTAIQFSVDAFHQEFIPFHSVHTAIDTARTTGLDEITVISQYLGPVYSKNPFNEKTELYLERLRLPKDFKTIRTSLPIEGRACDQLRNHLGSTTTLRNTKCTLPSWIGETLKNPKTIEIDFLGNVTICPGLCIGNTKTEPLARILQEYDYAQHPIIKTIVENGPDKIPELKQPKRGIGNEKHVNACHLCYESRRQLRGCYPESLAPESCYEEQ
jgi:hypothetical protein